MGKEFVYALYHYKDGVDKKIYFYVGRSYREVGVRFKEHQRAASSNDKRFATDVYDYIRKEVVCGIFEEEILCWVDDDNPQDYEDFFVIKLIREGHNLQNEKHGDQKRIAAIADAKELGDVALRDVTELREYRRIREERIAGERAAKLREGVLEGTANPRPNIGVQDFLGASAVNAMKARKEKALKAARRKEQAEWREREHQEWLQKNQKLFDAGDRSMLPK